MSTVLEVKTVVETKQAEKNIDNLNKDLETTGEATKGLTDSLDRMSGGAITAFRSIVSGAKSGVMAMTTLKGAIAATGIGALVIAVGALVSWFTKTQRGADVLNQAMAVIGTTIDVLIDRFSTFGEGIYKIFTGDFSEGLDILKGSLDGVTDEILNESKAALQLEKDFQALEKRKIAFIVQEEKLRAQISASRLESENFNKSVAERIEANNKALELEKQLADEKIAQVAEELRITKAQNALGESMNEDLQKEAELEAALFRIETDRDTRLKELVAKQRTLNAEMGKGREARGYDAETLEPLDSMGASDLSPEGEIELKQNEMLNSMLAKQNEQFSKDQIDRKAREEKEKQELSQKTAEVEQSISLGIAAIQSLIADKGSKEAKALAVAQVLFDTYRGIQSAFATAQANVAATTGTFGAYPFIQAAAAAAFGFANVRSILSAPTSGGSGGSFSSPSTSAPRPNQNELPNIPNFRSINQGVGGGDFANNRAVVVTQDIRDAELLDTRIRDISSLNN